MKKNKIAGIVFIISILLIMGSDFYGFYSSFSIPKGRVLDGIAHLSEESFDEKTVYPLSGKWLYESEIYQERRGLVQVPSLWNDESEGSIVTEPFDLGVLETRLELPAKGNYTLQIDYISSAYEIIINDEVIFESGRVGDSYENERPSWKPQMISFYTPSEAVKLEIRMSNFHHFKRGVIRHIFIGKQEAVFEHMIKDAIQTLLYVGISFGIAIYVLFMSRLHLWESSLYYLAAMCMFSGMLQLCRGVNLVYYLVANIEVVHIIKLQYLFIGGLQITSILFMFLTYCDKYVSERYKRYFYYWIAIDVLYIVFVLFMPSFKLLNTNPLNILIMWTNMMIGLFLLITATKYKNRNGRFSLYIFIIVIIYVGIDVIAINQYSYLPFTSNSASTGFLGLIIGQVYIITLIIEQELLAKTKGDELEIAFLQSQIAPHFFFNTLNTLMGVMEESIEDAQELLVDFSQYLRAKFVFAKESNRDSFIQDELSLVQNYVRIEQKRFGEMIQYQEFIDPNSLNISMPRLMIQPLVENAIRHGYKSNQVKVTLTVDKIDDGVLIKVEDSGGGFSIDELAKINAREFFDESEGIGLKSIYLRLRALNQADLTITSSGGSTSISYIWRPYEYSNN